MATLTLEIEDNQLSFFKKLIQNFKFVQVQKIVTDEFDGDTDQEIIENIKKGVAEMRLVEAGKMSSRPAREFLAEL
jgi:hypothetical protein